MHPVLSPAEALGLSGAALNSRVRNSGLHMPDWSLARIARQLSADALANEVIYEHEGVREAVRIMLRPLLAHRDQFTYVHYVCLRICEALSQIPRLFLEHEEIRKIVAVTGEEEQWLRDIWSPSHGRNNAVYGRLDAVCDFTSANWRDTLKFMEPNLSGVGGIHFAPIAERLVMRDIVPAILEHDPGLVIELPQDQRDLFVQLLIDHARAVGRNSCQLCFIEPKYENDGPDEQEPLRRYLSERHGLTIAHADPRELTVRDGEVYYQDTRIDVAYRDYEMRDLIALEREIGSPLEGMRLLFRENRIISSLVGDFDHKSGFEILTDRNVAERLFTPDDCRLFYRHVLWTRVVADRRTTLPDGSVGDLLEFLRRHREELVLKPNRGYGGAGVAIGATMQNDEWERIVAKAAADAANPNASWVVQSATALPVVEFPVVGPSDQVHYEPFYTVMGFAPTDNGVGALCRVSQKRVVNVAQHGGLATLLIGEAPNSLRIPKRPDHASGDAKKALRREITELLHLDQAIGLMEWDEEVMLPVRGRQQRGEQMATLEGLRHSILVSDRLGDLIEDVAARIGGDEDLARELALLRRQRKRALAVPRDLVRSFANAKSQTLAAWEEARARDDFDVFALPFSQLVSVVRERAQCLGTDRNLYDALLEDYEPGMTKARLEPLFGQLRERLVPMVHNARRDAGSKTSPSAESEYPAKAQWELSRLILRSMGFDFDRGRLDPSTHPFTMQAGDDDVRVTGRSDPTGLSGLILTALHEGGHALYDQGLNERYRDTLLADGASSGMHEGQARLWENHVGRDPAFLDFLSPHLVAMFPDIGGKRGVEKLLREMNALRPNVIRVGADEITYQLHIFMRYQLENALLDSNLAVSELPHLWNSMSRELFGISPRNHREGVLQDVHWAVGMFGYFPTYTIGSLYAAQLVKTYSRDHDLKAEIRAGDFASLRGWLAKGIYAAASRLSAEEIMVSVTGSSIDTAAFFEHLAEAYPGAR